MRTQSQTFFVTAKIKNLKKITEIFKTFCKSDIFGVKIKNLKKSLMSHLII